MQTRQKVAGAVAAGLMGLGFLLMVRAVVRHGPIEDEAASQTTSARPEPGAIDWTTPPAGAPAPRRDPIEVSTDGRDDPTAPIRGASEPAEDPSSPTASPEEPREPDPRPAERAVVLEQAPPEPARGVPSGPGAPAQAEPLRPASAVKVRREDPKAMKVAEATLCAGVKDRTPVKPGTSFASTGKVYCWVRIANGEKRKVRMVWRLGGQESTGEWLEIGSPWWRTWSFKTLPKGFKGDATVSVVDEAGAVLKRIDFKVR